MDDQWQRAKQLFVEALQLPPDERELFLTRNCDQAELVAEVQRLLAHHDDDSAFLDAPTHLSPGTGVVASHSLEGQTIGHFQIGGCLGQGGMGTVYEAIQDQPRRSVAIKVLRPDWGGSESKLRRFAQESEVLGRLQHPGIAHVYESGIWESGTGPRPWFAMERVEGVPLQTWLQTNQADLDTKLDLLLKIGNAVQHAHDRGVVHRDLKPGNILVVDSGQGIQPKVVDFGIARVLDAGHDLTATREILGTLDYLSPEQVRDADGELDHRVDVYALGLIGFELVSGQLPHDRRSGPMLETLSRIGELDSDRLREFGKSWSRDLQVIFGKAMHESPDRRYQTVREFSDDILRYLNGEPILARPPTAIYLASRFFSRNRAWVLGSVATIVALLIGLVLYANEAERARQAAESASYEAEKATEVNSYITNDFLTRLLAASRRAPGQKAVDVETLVDQSATHIESMFGDRPTIQAAIHNEVGTIYYNIHAMSKAEQQFRLAWELWRDALGDKHPDTLKALSNRAQSRIGAEMDEQTLAMLREAYESRVEVLGEEDAATRASLNNLAEGLRRMERIEEAVPLLERAVYGRRQNRRPDSPGQLAAPDKATLIAAANLGSVYLAQGQTEQALLLHRDVYQAASQQLGADHVTSTQAGLRYARTLDHAGKYQSALEVVEPIRARVGKTVGDDVGGVISTYRLSARIYRHLQQKGQATKVLQEALELTEGEFGEQQQLVDQQRARISRDLRRLEAD